MEVARSSRSANRATAWLLVPLAGWFCGCASRLLLYPTREPLRIAEGLERREVAVPDGVVEVWVARSQPARPVDSYVLAFDGNGSRAEHCARLVASLFADRSIEVWAVNYPGYGGSSGDADLGTMAPSGLAAYDALVSVSAGRPVTIYGCSIGGTVALHVAAKRPVAGVLLMNPPPLRRMILQRHGWWNLWLLALPVALSVPGDLDVIDTATNVTAPCVFVTSNDDEVVPVPYQDRVFEAYRGPKQRIWQVGGHNDSPDRGTIDQIRAATAEFMK